MKKNIGESYCLEVEDTRLYLESTGSLIVIIVVIPEFADILCTSRYQGATGRSEWATLRHV